MKTIKKKLGVKDFERMLNDRISPFLAVKIKEANFVYSPIDNKKRDECLIKIISALLDDTLIKTGEHRQPQWEKGWQENLDDFKKTKKPESLVPMYYRKYDIVRIFHEFVKSESPYFESNLMSIVMYWIADKHLRDTENIFEFGCGPGHNLLKIREVNPKATIWGLDWTNSSQKLVKELARANGDKRMFSRKFDFFKPDLKFRLPPHSAVLTITSLEQVGDKYKKFIDYVLKNKPRICVHVEPEADLLNPNVLLDYLSIKYFEKRNYSFGLLAYLKKLESEGKIKIILAEPTHQGSLFIDGKPVIIWKPT